MQLWDVTYPATAIAGINFDRSTVAAALRNQPPGTFICRVSLTQPGSLVISCRVPPSLASPDDSSGDGVVHLMVPLGQLKQQRVDGWLRSMPGATHLLDVYSGARVEKGALLKVCFAGGSSQAAAAPAAVAAAAPVSGMVRTPQGLVNGPQGLVNGPQGLVTAPPGLVTAANGHGRKRPPEQQDGA